MSGADASFLLLLGVVAAFNPCGFALLPAYITVIVTGAAEASVSRPRAIRRAIGFGLAMTLGFVAVFTAFGLLTAGANAAWLGRVTLYLPYVTAALGAVIVALGVVMLWRGELRGPGLRFAGRAPGATFVSQTLYGATFALVSLSCAIGPFFAVVATALAATGPVGAVTPFVIYAVGMGSAVLAVSVAAAFAGAGLALALRRRTVVIIRVGGVVMIVAGLYVVAYALAELLPQFGIRAFDSLLLTTATWQGSVVSAIQDWGAAVLVILVALVAVGSAALLIATRTRRRTFGPDAPVGPATSTDSRSGEGFES